MTAFWIWSNYPQIWLMPVLLRSGLKVWICEDLDSNSCNIGAFQCACVGLSLSLSLCLAFSVVYWEWKYLHLSNRLKLSANFCFLQILIYLQGCKRAVKNHITERERAREREKERVRGSDWGKQRVRQREGCCQHALQRAKCLKHLLIQHWHKHIAPIPWRASGCLRVLLRVCVRWT